MKIVLLFSLNMIFLSEVKSQWHGELYLQAPWGTKLSIDENGNMDIKHSFPTSINILGFELGVTGKYDVYSAHSYNAPEIRYRTKTVTKTVTKEVYMPRFFSITHGDSVYNYRIEHGDKFEFEAPSFGEYTSYQRNDTLYIELDKYSFARVLYKGIRRSIPYKYDYPSKKYFGSDSNGSDSFFRSLIGLNNFNDIIPLFNSDESRIINKDFNGEGIDSISIIDNSMILQISDNHSLEFYYTEELYSSLASFDQADLDFSLLNSFGIPISEIENWIRRNNSFGPSSLFRVSEKLKRRGSMQVLSVIVNHPMLPFEIEFSNYLRPETKICDKVTVRINQDRSDKKESLKNLLGEEKFTDSYEKATLMRKYYLKCIENSKGVTGDYFIFGSKRKRKKMMKVALEYGRLRKEFFKGSTSIKPIEVIWQHLAYEDNIRLKNAATAKIFQIDTNYYLSGIN